MTFRHEQSSSLLFRALKAMTTGTHGGFKFMKMRLKLKANDSEKEVAVTLSVRTNQPGHHVTLAQFESQRKFDYMCNLIHDALRKEFN